MIQCSHLRKRYKGKLAVDDISFTVERGKVTGFLGPNGAGKSTTMRLMLGLDLGEGATTYAGKTLRDYGQPLRVVGALIETQAFHPTRSAYEHLAVWADASSIPKRRVQAVLEMVGLAEVAHKGPGKFSLGMRQRLGIAAAILGDPAYLILDEPANGLDPEGVAWLRQFMRDYAKAGNAVFVSSHLLSEMALMADNVVIIGRGKLLANTEVQKLTSDATHKHVFVRAEALKKVEKALRDASITFTQQDGGVLITGAGLTRVAKLVQMLFAKILAAARAQLTADGVDQLTIDETLRKVVHHEVLWADLTTDLTNRYLQLAYQEPNFFWGHFARRIDPLAIQIMQYIKDKGDKSTGSMNILRDVDADIRRILKFDNVGEDPAPADGQHTIFIAHSLGSVIAFDYVMGFRRPYRLEASVTVDSFITLGSPLPLFTSAMGHPDSDCVLPPHVLKWVNIRSPRDGIARPMRPFFRNIPIEEYQVKNRFWPLAAHSAYWRDPQTATLIAYEVLRALDAPH